MAVPVTQVDADGQSGGPLPGLVGRVAFPLTTLVVATVLAGNPPVRVAVHLATLRRELGRHGFVLQATAADLPFARDLWLASFVRR